jgi:mannose-1-phosphate guanylyltransferase
MAGGSGERLWPLSTPENPKQFVSLFGGKMLIQHAVDRLDGLVAAERIFVITAKSLVPMTRKALA